jgi:metal-sulfur cluster biosynthetic enzyme
VTSTTPPATDERFRYTGDDTQRGTITAALERVIDPEMSLDIVNLGLVYGVAVTPGAVDIELTMTSAACPVSELIVADVRRELAQTLGPGYAIGVELSWEPPWTPERMSGRARAAFGWE